MYERTFRTLFVLSDIKRHSNRIRESRVESRVMMYSELYECIPSYIRGRQGVSRSTVCVDRMKREVLAGERLAVLGLCMVLVSVRFPSST